MQTPSDFAAAPPSPQGPRVGWSETAGSDKSQQGALGVYYTEEVGRARDSYPRAPAPARLSPSMPEAVSMQYMEAWELYEHEKIVMSQLQIWPCARKCRQFLKRGGPYRGALIVQVARSLRELILLSRVFIKANQFPSLPTANTIPSRENERMFRHRQRSTILTQTPQPGHDG